MNRRKLLTIALLLSFSGYPCLGSEKKYNNHIGEGKDEKQYSNGTIIGKYSYADNDGNPIFVKYYADKSGYGVELKSIKIDDPGRILMPALAQKINTPVNESNGIKNKYLLQREKISDMFKTLLPENIKGPTNDIYRYTLSNNYYEKYPNNINEIPRKKTGDKSYLYNFTRNRKDVIGNHFNMN